MRKSACYFTKFQIIICVTSDGFNKGANGAAAPAPAPWDTSKSDPPPQDIALFPHNSTRTLVACLK